MAASFKCKLFIIIIILSYHIFFHYAVPIVAASHDKCAMQTNCYPVADLGFTLLLMSHYILLLTILSLPSVKP